MTNETDTVVTGSSDLQTLTVDQWQELSKTGANIAVQVTPKGVSMLPLIVQGRDRVVIYPVRRPLMLGDIVLFKRQDGANVLHRVWKINGDKITTFGDGCLRPDYPIDKSAVLGIAEILYRKNKEYCVNTKWSRFQGKVWWCLRPVRWVKSLPRRIARKVIREWLGIKRKSN